MVVYVGPQELGAKRVPRPVPKADQVDLLEDLARSGLSGLGQGVAGVIGMPADIANMAVRGGDWLGRKSGLVDDTPEHQEWLEDRLRQANANVPTSDKVLAAMNTLTRGFGPESDGLFE